MFDVHVPLPRTLSATGDRHRFRTEGGWRIYSPRYAPPPTLAGHLTFALKHEGLDLAVLKRLFTATGPAPIEAVVKDTPTGTYARRVWFLYEWLTGLRLDLPDASRGAYPPVVDPRRQYAPAGETSSRHRVRNNLPGTPAFCPLVSRTETLERCIAWTCGPAPNRPRRRYPASCWRERSLSCCSRTPGRASPSKANGHRRVVCNAGATRSDKPACTPSMSTNYAACSAS